MAIALTDWQRERAIKWFEKGLTVVDIATILGRSDIVVAAALQLAGARSPPRVTKQRDRDAQYREGFEAGFRACWGYVVLYGAEAVHRFWMSQLVSWRNHGEGHFPPCFEKEENI